MRALAEAFSQAGFTVELPLLPGHGTTVEDLAETNFVDWASAAEKELEGLIDRTQRVVVVGLSMGGTIGCWLATRHLLDALIVINPLVKPPVPELLTALEQAVSGGTTVMAMRGNDTKKPNVDGGGYDVAPLGSLLTLLASTGHLENELKSIVCPVLIFSSKIDHVVPFESSDLLEENVGGPVERVVLFDSYHLATLDNDAPEIERRAVAFAQRFAVA